MIQLCRAMCVGFFCLWAAGGGQATKIERGPLYSGDLTEQGRLALTQAGTSYHGLYNYELLRLAAPGPHSSDDVKKAAIDYLIHGIRSEGNEVSLFVWGGNAQAFKIDDERLHQAIAERLLCLLYPRVGKMNHLNTLHDLVQLETLCRDGRLCRHVYDQTREVIVRQQQNALHSEEHMYQLGAAYSWCLAQKGTGASTVFKEASLKEIRRWILEKKCRANDVFQEFIGDAASLKELKTDFFRFFAQSVQQEALEGQAFEGQAAYDEMPRTGFLSCLTQLKEEVPLLSVEDLSVLAREVSFQSESERFSAQTQQRTRDVALDCVLKECVRRLRALRTRHIADFYKKVFSSWSETVRVSRDGEESDREDFGWMRDRFMGKLFFFDTLRSIDQVLQDRSPDTPHALQLFAFDYAIEELERDPGRITAGILMNLMKNIHELASCDGFDAAKIDLAFRNGAAHVDFSLSALPGGPLKSLQFLDRVSYKSGFHTDLHHEVVTQFHKVSEGIKDMAFDPLLESWVFLENKGEEIFGGSCQTFQDQYKDELLERIQSGKISIGSLRKVNRYAVELENSVPEEDEGEKARARTIRNACHEELGLPLLAQ